MLVGERIIVKDLAEDLYDGQVLQKLFGKKKFMCTCWVTLSVSGSLVPTQEPWCHLTFMPLSDIKIALYYETLEQ
mgnify:CR=1 FL=1